MINQNSGKLYIVATPIGNLGDISTRAIEILKLVDLIACEDTRVTKKLLDAYSIETRTVSLHQHSTDEKVNSLINDIVHGKKLALVTDAGTPAISDPGSIFIAKAITLGIQIIPIPGASALTTALCVCGFPTNIFTFVGFPPNKKGRNTFFRYIAEIPHTVVLYESKHRIVKTLKALPQDRKLMVGREMTKMFETIYRGDATTISAELIGEHQKGEFVLVLGPQK